LRRGVDLCWQVIRRVLLTVVCIYIGAAAVISFRRSRPDATWALIQQAGVIRVGMDASYPPFADVVAGAPAGLDVDIAVEIGRRIGLRVEIVTVGYDGLYDVLLNRRVDMVISALAFDPMRLGDVIYTRPYLDAGQVLVSPAGATQRMDQLEGRTLAVEFGSLGDEAARQWERRLSKLTVSRHSTSAAALEAVISGQAEAALVDVIAARLYRRRAPQLHLAGRTTIQDPMVIAVRRRSYDLASVIDAQLEAMQADGTLARLLDKWL
jgi:ABC-type amino acid transport substrate-binding protein